MNASLTLEQIIQEEFEAVIAEQRGAVFKQAPTVKFNAKRIAKQIYDAKGTFSDNEQSAINAIRQIKNIEQYKQVLKVLQKLTDGRGTAQYLKSFLSPGDLVEVAIHLYDVLPSNSYSWTVKKIVSYDDLKTALSTLSGRGSRYNKMQYGDLPGRAINQIRKMIEDPALYKDLEQRDDLDRKTRKGVRASDILFRPFVSTEYYLTHNTWESFINADGGLRDMVYSPAGIGITTTMSLIPTPWTKIPVAILFGILAVDDVTRIIDGNDEAWFDLLFDVIGVIFGTGAGGALRQALRPIAKRFISFIKWIKSGGILFKISQKMFATLIQLVEAFSKTKLGNFLAGGVKTIDSLWNIIKSGVTKSLNLFKSILVKLKNSTPDPIKSWAANALNTLKAMPAELFMQEIKPMFDAFRMLAKVTREFIRAPKTAILDLARRLGISSEWVVPVAHGAQAFWVAKLFYDGIPAALGWWEKWVESQMNQQQQEQWKRDLRVLVKEYQGRIYSFKKKPGQSIELYAYYPGMDPEWDNFGTKIIKTDGNSNGPVCFIVDKKQDGYARITIPSVMQGVGELNKVWVKLSDIQQLNLK